MNPFSLFYPIYVMSNKDFRATHRATQKPGKSLMSNMWIKMRLMCILEQSLEPGTLDIQCHQNPKLLGFGR